MTTTEDRKSSLDAEQVGYKQSLGRRHVQMIAIGGAIGTGLFLGSASRLHNTGPALLLSYATVGVIAYFLMRALGELVLHRQTSGAFVSYMREFFGEKAAFVTGWMYWLNWALTGIAELSAVGIYVKHYYPSVPSWVSVLIALAVVLAINLLSARAFGEFEFWASVLKVGAIVIFLAVGLVVVIGRVHIGSHQAGFSNLYNNPGGFWPASGAFVWYGPILVMSGVVFAYAAIEMVGVAAGEMENPEREVPKAVNSVIFRIGVFYCGSILLLVSMLPTSDYTAGTSPFVTIFGAMGMNWMGDVIQAVLIVAAMSSLNSGLYSTGRVLRSLGMSKQAPQFTLLMSKSGVPWAGIVMTSIVYVFGAILNAVDPDAFETALEAASLGVIFTWGTIFVCQLRLRKLVRTGIIRKSSFQMPGSPYTSIIGLVDPGVSPAGAYPTAPTAYRTAGLTVSTDEPGADQRVRAAVDEALRGHGWEADHRPFLIRLRPGDGATGTVDAWTLMSQLRRHQDPDVAAGIGLDHLMSTAEQLGGNPLAVGHGRVGLDHYGDAGYAGRGPVNFLIPAPVPRGAGRRPRVVVLDTGIGDHPWFRERPAQTTITMADGSTVGPEVDPGSIQGVDPDGRGAVADALLGTLATHSGHGTFIAGLLRQVCPEADIVALAVMGADGIVAESTLTDALRTVACRQQEEPEWADALVLSLGYYAESDADLAYNSALRRILLELGRLGVAVFCAAGNDATSRPSYPAAFAVDPAFRADDMVPLTSVAALNPDGTVAQFSNDGPWVVAEAPGVNLVSTAPVNTDGSARAGMRMAGPLGRPRGGVDPDGFESGFASWSGTSFAAPVLAGRYMQRLIDAGFPDAADRRALVPTGRGGTTAPVRSHSSASDVSG